MNESRNGSKIRLQRRLLAKEINYFDRKRRQIYRLHSNNYSTNVSLPNPKFCAKYIHFVIIDYFEDYFDWICHLWNLYYPPPPTKTFLPSKHFLTLNHLQIVDKARKINDSISRDQHRHKFGAIRIFGRYSWIRQTILNIYYYQLWAIS